jgi:hypothetical protein
MGMAEAARFAANPPLGGGLAQKARKLQLPIVLTQAAAVGLNGGG